MYQTGRRCFCKVLTRWRFSKILPNRRNGGAMFAGASRRHAPGQQQALVRNSIPALIRKYSNFLSKNLERRYMCFDNYSYLAKPKSAVDEEAQLDNGGDEDGTGERRRNRAITMGKRVVVGMSGGVDSSVAAMLLQKQGYDVIGVFMKNWDMRDEAGAGGESEVCTADVDLEDVRMVGRHLGIPIQTVDFSRDYWHQVFAPSMEEFSQCRTPNMDVACNRFIKFDAFRKHALVRLGADLVATGHYARLRPGPGGNREKPELVQALDENKDQTYFLCGVPSEALAKVLFPLGGLSKPEVRELAVKTGLPVAQKRESMGVCFVGKRKSWGDFISQYISPSPGNFVCADSGEIIGKHRGVQLYTIGQKSHLDGMDEKYYVVGLDAETNSVIVARGASNPTLYARGLSCLSSEFHWVAGIPPVELTPHLSSPGLLQEAVGTAANGSAESGEDCARSALQGTEGDGSSVGEPRRARLRCTYRCRHRQELQPCTVELLIARPGSLLLLAPAEGRAAGGRGEGGNIFSKRETQYAAEGLAAPRDHCDQSTVEGESVDECKDNGRTRAVATDGVVRSEEALSTAALVVLCFDDPARAVAPGQVVALYRDGVCLGGGPILRAEGRCSPVLVRTPPPLPLPPAPRRSRRTQRNRGT